MEHGPVKLGMVVLMQHDLEKAVEFYKNLDLKVKFHLKDKWAELDLGCVKLGLCPTEHKQETIRTGVVLETFKDLHQLYEKMKADGVEFLMEPITKPHGIMVAFKDPGGNVLDLYQATPDKLKDFVKEQGDKDKKQED